MSFLGREKGASQKKITVKTRKRLELDVSTNLHQTFHAGQIASCIHEWKKLTSDPTNV